METKIPFYNILNMFLTGFIFIGCCILIYNGLFINLLFSIDFSKIAIPSGLEIIITISFFGTIYEVGYIINRIGSILIEPIFKKVKIIFFNDNYKKFNDCKKDYPILNTLSREYALSRTTFTLFLISTILSIFQKEWKLLVVFILICLIFALSCRKHSKKIINIMK